MITSEEAFRIICSTSIERNTEIVKLRDARGRMLAEDIYADRDFPPFDRVTMDGIAINSKSWEQGNRIFMIESLQAAGSPRSTLQNQDNAIEIMTGAILPDNVDVVIKYEETEKIENEGTKKLKVYRKDVQPFMNVHRKGEDREKGDLLIPKGRSISSPEIAVMASVGKSAVEVLIQPKVAIIATGDELVDVDTVPLPHQIRKSNIYNLQGQLDAMGFESSTFHLIDNKKILEERLTEIMKQFPLLILSGGVSMGKLDFVPEILKKLGVKELFHRVKQRPGKPLWFGKSENNIVFALPGNPVSTFVSFVKYIRGWIFAFLHFTPAKMYATLTEDLVFKPDFTYFLQVKVNCTSDGKLEATPVSGHGSGDHANLLDCDGIMELPAGKETFSKGENYEVLLYRNIFGIS